MEWLASQPPMVQDCPMGQGSSGQCTQGDRYRVYDGPYSNSVDLLDSSKGQDQSCWLSSGPQSKVCKLDLAHGAGQNEF